MNSNLSSTQQSIPIAGIKDGVVLLRTGGYRVILSVAAVNFALKSEQEQNSLVFQYQGFLNSLHFPIQIVMQSKRLDLAPYINKIKQMSESQSNELLRAQTDDYIDFVGQLINVANIMKKSFYVVVPYDPISINSGSILDKLFKKQPSPNLKISDTEYKRYHDELMERANIVANGLGSMGLHCVQLKTDEIIELFYKINNPEVYSKERLSNPEELTNSFIASENEKQQPNLNQTDQQTPQQNNEAVIDNSYLVQEHQKNEFKQQQRETEKSLEKDVRGPQTPEANNDSQKEPAPQATQTVSPNQEQDQNSNFGN